MNEVRVLVRPGVVLIDTLSAMYDFFRFCRIRVDEFELAREIVGVTNFKENEIAFCEIITDTTGPRSYHRFAERQTFKNTRRSIEISENAAAIWDNSYIAVLDNGGDVGTILNAQIFNVICQTAFRRRVHGLCKKWSAFSANYQPRLWD